ncbi:TetR/AcrR family transcriptional regulator [Gordonia rubripertincta]|uniref:TetR/AcrR family transcriptional regulator n=1 Tax=Gordonia rubripertincta TaxID=36822 RepID=A0ABT4MVK4_GORRU|nr:TetR/AcrR family transcriptional regulator [Gordonia rubripertincta]MCZ4551039.1 TetR/AcrR family transcriptional regulator [Gordonia rubripertincta]
MSRPPVNPPLPATTRRRQPSQERSRNLVHAVLDATAQVLQEVGLEATSTNKVAKRAGVSVGSIYRYFPNKEALFDALVDDRIELLKDVASERMSELTTQTFPHAAEAMVRATIDFFGREPAVTLLILSRTANPNLSEHDQQLFSRMHAVARQYLALYADSLTVPDLDLTATISLQVVSHFAPHIALAITGHDERELFIAEIVRMLSAFVGVTP